MGGKGKGKKTKTKISGSLEMFSKLLTSSRIIECGKYSKEPQMMSEGRILMI
jgi:hypothetical protein